MASLQITLLLLVAVLGTALAVRRWGTWERRVAMGSMAAHIASAAALEFVYRVVYSGGDMIAYHRIGRLLSRYLELTPGGYVDVLQLLTQTDAHPLPFYVFGEGSSTGSMCALAAFLDYWWSVDLSAQNAVIAMLSGIGGILTFASIRREISPASRRWTAVVAMLLPSVVFWTSGLLKESVIAFPIGLLFYGVAKSGQHRTAAVVCILVGATVVGLLKSYVLAGFVIGLPAWWLSRRALKQGQVFQVSASRVFAFALLSVVFIVGFGAVFKNYSVESLGAELAGERLSTLSVAGGSTYSLIGGQTNSLWQQLLYAPIALFTVVFRPLPFEVTNLQIGISALETLTVGGMVIYFFRAASPKALFREIAKRPQLFLMLLYSLSVGLGVGLATTNLGALSRYRAPMFGTLATVLVAISLSAKEAKRKSG